MPSVRLPLYALVLALVLTVALRIAASDAAQPPFQLTVDAITVTEAPSSADEYRRILKLLEAHLRGRPS